MMSYVLYIGVLFTCWMLARFADQYNNKKCVWAVVIILTLFSGLRAYSVGIDTSNYVNSFNLIEDGELRYAYGLETSFKYICYGFLSIIPSSTALLTFLALITHGFIIWRMWDFRQVAAFGTMVACYYMGFFFLSLNVIRQFCAIAIVVYSSRFLSRHQNIRYLIGVMIASLFHTSALIAVVFLGLKLLRWKQLEKKEKAFYLSTAVLSPLLGSYLISRMVRYEGHLLFVGFDGGTMVPIKIAFYVGTLLFIYAFYGRSNHFADWDILKEETAGDIQMVHIMYGLGLMMLLASYFFPVLNRAGLYFSIFECFYMGTLVRTKHELHRGVFGFCSIMIVGYGFIMAMLENEQGTMPYLFIWQ